MEVQKTQVSLMDSLHATWKKLFSITEVFDNCVNIQSVTFYEDISVSISVAKGMQAFAVSVSVIGPSMLNCVPCIPALKSHHQTQEQLSFRKKKNPHKPFQLIRKPNLLEIRMKSTGKLNFLRITHAIECAETFSRKGTVAEFEIHQKEYLQFSGMSIIDNRSIFLAPFQSSKILISYSACKFHPYWKFSRVRCNYI